MCFVTAMAESLHKVVEMRAWIAAKEHGDCRLGYSHHTTHSLFSWLAPRRLGESLEKGIIYYWLRTQGGSRFAPLPLGCYTSSLQDSSSAPSARLAHLLTICPIA